MAVCPEQGPRGQAALQQPETQPLTAMMWYILVGGSPGAGRAVFRRQAPFPINRTRAEALRTKGTVGLSRLCVFRDQVGLNAKLPWPYPSSSFPWLAALPQSEMFTETEIWGVVAGGTQAPSKWTYLLGACAMSTQGHQPTALGLGSDKHTWR